MSSMTLIVNAVTQHFIVHASDRLLTKRVGGRFFVHSNIENKSLIVVAEDAICIIGYTGAAYIGDLITDEWIASIITKSKFDMEFMHQSGGVGKMKLNSILYSLETAIAGLILPGSANYLAISISGMRRRGRYIRPFIREIERNRGTIMKRGYMRHPRSPHFHVLSQIGDTMKMADLQVIIGREFIAHGISAEAFRLGMIRAVRERAKSSKVVGDEIMTVTIKWLNGIWEVVWNFESPRPRQGALADAFGNVKKVIESFFSPWIITRGGITRPSFGNGHFEHTIGNVSIRCGNKLDSMPEKDWVMAVSHQERAPKK